MQVDILKKWVLPIGTLLCGLVLCPYIIDQTNAPRHIIWCIMVLVLALCTKKIRYGTIHYFALGYLGFVLFSGLFAINRSEWFYWVVRLLLVISYLSVVEIDKKLLTKAMIILGTVFAVYFWWEYLDVGKFFRCRGLMRQRNTWAAAHFFIIPFCYYAIKEKFWRPEAIITLILMVVHIFLLNSRSSALAVFLSAGVVAVMVKKIRWYVIGIGVVGLVFLSKGNLLSLQHRLEQWKYTMDMIIAHPFGVGAGNWWILFPKYASGISYEFAFKTEVYRFPHNDFWWIWAEVGLGGLICYLGMFGLALKTAVKNKQTYLIIGLVGYMAIAFFSVMRERPFSSLMMVTFIVLACDRPYRIKQPRILLTILILVLVVFGFCFRASYWNKRVRRSKTNAEFIERAKGYSVFSTLGYTGIPWQWWSGVANLQMGKPSLGISQIEKAYSYNPYNIFVLNAMGEARKAGGDNEQAKEFYEKALKICPDFDVAKNNLEEIEKKLKRSKKWQR